MVASVKLNDGVASVSPSEILTPPNEIELFSNNVLVTSPVVNVSCFVANKVDVSPDKSAISRDNSLDA